MRLHHVVTKLEAPITLHYPLEDGLWRPSVSVAAFANI